MISASPVWVSQPDYKSRDWELEVEYGKSISVSMLPSSPFPLTRAIWACSAQREKAHLLMFLSYKSGMMSMPHGKLGCKRWIHFKLCMFARRGQILLNHLSWITTQGMQLKCPNLIRAEITGTYINMSPTHPKKGVRQNVTYAVRHSSTISVTSQPLCFEETNCVEQ